MLISITDSIEEFELDRTFDSKFPKDKTPAHDLKIKQALASSVVSNAKDGEGEGISTRVSSPAPSAAASQTVSKFGSYLTNRRPILIKKTGKQRRTRDRNSSYEHGA